MANEFDNLDLPAFTDCEIRSLKVLDAEIDRINNHYNNLIEESKKETDRKIQDCGGLRKYQNLIEQKKKDLELQYTPGEQTLVTHVGEAIAKCRTKVEKLEEAHQSELKVIEEKREKKLQDINKARARRKQTNIEKESGEINIEVTRRDILKVEVEDLKEVIKTLETREGHYRELVNRPNLTAYSKAIYTRKFEVASNLRKAFSVRLDRRKNILKGKAQDTTERSDTDISDHGYSDCSDIEGSLYREKYNIRKREKRKPFPREQDFPEEEVTGNTSFDNTVVENNPSENSSYIQSEVEEEEGDILSELDLDSDLEEENMAQNRGNGRWSLKDLPQFHGKRDGLEHPSTHLMEFEDTLEAMGIQVTNFDENDDDIGNEIENLVNKFKASLKNKARKWYQTSILQDPRTPQQWEELKAKFKAQYNPVGITQEQQIKAWKGLEWDPTDESLDDFTYRFIELAEGMGIGQEQRLYSFNCCLPGNLYLYTQGSQTIQEALTKLKRGMALGTCLGANIGNPMESKQSTSGTAPIPFMMTSDKSVNFSTDTIVNESIKRVKDTIKQDNKEILEQIERVAVAFEKFGQDRSRNRSRDKDNRNRDNRRSSNDRYSRGPSRSPDRGSYDRRSYSSYRDNSRDRYDRRDRYSRKRSRSPGDYNSRGYRGRSNSGSRYQGSRQPPKKCSFCSRTGHLLELSKIFGENR